jgi:hypothetical protein
MLVEAAWCASKALGPLRAFYQLIRARRGMQIAVVATARKLAVLCRHLIIKGEDYAFTRPSLVAHKQRTLELRAGAPAARGRKGTTASYSLQAVRAAEREMTAQAEVAYRTIVASWQPTRPALKPPRMKVTELPVPTSCSSLGGRPHPPQPTLPRSSPVSGSYAGQRKRPGPTTPSSSTAVDTPARTSRNGHSNSRANR